MIIKDISFESAPENIFFDEFLLQEAEAGVGGEVLRYWEAPSHFIVLGRIGKAEDDLKFETINRDHISVLRRASGGGTVVQGPGCLNYTLVLNKENHPHLNDIKKSYHYILGKVVDVLSELGFEAQYLPISDVALSKTLAKISGNAQKRGRRFILHHGTILYQFDLALIEKYLKMPKEMPAYRQRRAHSNFVVNVPVNIEKFKDLLSQKFLFKQKIGTLTHEEMERFKQFIQKRKNAISVQANSLTA